MSFLDNLNPLQNGLDPGKSFAKNNQGAGVKPSGIEKDKFLNDQGILLAQARQFRTDIPQMQGQTAELSREGLRRGLRDRIKSGDSALSSRGLLNSGIRQGNVANAFNEYKSAANQVNLDASNQLRSQLGNMQQGIIKQGQDFQKMEQQYNDQAYQQALAGRQAGSNILGAPGKMLGGFLGG